ncbi:hypothetical protein RyT2_07830 [Pseudolactococcus yaeyamensis]
MSYKPELAKIKFRAERLIQLLGSGAFGIVQDELTDLKRDVSSSEILTERQREFLTEEIITKAEKQIYHYEKTLTITKSVANKMTESLGIFNWSDW